VSWHDSRRGQGRQASSQLLLLLLLLLVAAQQQMHQPTLLACLTWCEGFCCMSSSLECLVRVWQQH
jgi:hypothetical protein